jgi:hypothetical protein
MNQTQTTKPIDAGTLRDWLETSESVTVADVRRDDDRAQWSIRRNGSGLTCAVAITSCRRHSIGLDLNTPTPVL